jgi:hypothetical protein
VNDLSDIRRCTESLAVVLFWAAWELYPPNPDNPVAKMTPEEAFSKANSEQRRLARYQAARAMQHLGLVAP